ncbi:YlzJ-like family protein [Bacillus sp. B1-b2]|uniref:YlzJ-like family protein n=1 Tax=Bacillus sp. B1-b2 TaxID=2653201 RepID=UPI0012629401|nr:YlzJ-like family protein [Bacillus sp. B1-b2]KAB7668694.1 ribonuclease [Bacillus sp. B1-b2]
MIMYTMMPEELIFPYSQETFEQQQVINYNGIPLLVARTETSEYEVIRILSTDPNHFLSSQFQPGSKITHI